jgi:hypothetical protein
MSLYPPSPSNTSGCTKTYTYAAKSVGVVYRSRRFPAPQTQIVRIRIQTNQRIRHQRCWEACFVVPAWALPVLVSDGLYRPVFGG